MEKQTLRYKRAIPMFILAYVGITIIATAASILVDVFVHPPFASSGLQDLGFQLIEKGHWKN